MQREGASFSGAHYSHATTYTGPGHTVISSGSYGHTSGIVGNRWWNASTRRIESMFFDDKAQLLGTDAVPKDDDTSPKNFIGSTFGDQLKLRDSRSKVIGLSNKDRAAIMLAGKLGRAYWFHENVGGLTSSTYYGGEFPNWVKAFNARKIPDSYFGKAWTKSLPEAAYALDRRDDFPAETDLKNLGRAFPHVLTDKSGAPSPDFYEAFTATPFATDYQFEAARAAIVNENLGADDVPDLLGISITAPDIAGHTFGPDSPEIRDTTARLDEQIAGFLRYLDARFKRGEVLLALTADHGAAPLPEYSQQLGLDAGRIKSKVLSDAAEAALTARFGAPEGGAKWVTAVEDPALFLNRELLAARKIAPADAEKVAGEALLSVPGIAQYFARESFVNNNADGRWAKFYEKSFHPLRGGDVMYRTQPFWFGGSYGNRETGSTHGSPYEYDTHVPLIFWGAGIAPSRRDQNVDMTDLAPTLSALCGVEAPAGSEGTPLFARVAAVRTARD